MPARPSSPIPAAAQRRGAPAALAPHQCPSPLDTSPSSPTPASGAADDTCWSACSASRSPRCWLAPDPWPRSASGPPGQHDFEADLPDGSVAALEVTAEVDDQRLDLAASAERRLSAIALPHSESRWLVGLAATARVNAIRPDALRRLLGELEASGRSSAHNIGDYRDPFVARLQALGIESIYAVNASAGFEGM